MNTHAIKLLSTDEFEKVVDYFMNLSAEDDSRMSIDRKNLLGHEEWINLLKEDSFKPLTERQFCYIGWIFDGRLIGHCGINKIKYGQAAFIHLHLWEPELRNQGLGLIYLSMAIDFYLDLFCLRKIICEPNVDNPAPNKILPKAGFVFCETYRTKPSIINYEHQVNRYEYVLKRE